MNPYDAYVSDQKLSMSDREVEASALTKAALLLKTCQESWDAPDRESRLTEALEFNQKLWSIFEASLLDANHPFPPTLRQHLLRLGSFIDSRIFDVMAYPAREKLTVIIQINQNLAMGLREGDSRQQESNQAPPSDTLREETVWA
jgi:flagellar protein FlaF